MPTTTLPPPQSRAIRSGRDAADQPAFLRTLHKVVEQRWRRTHSTRVGPAGAPEYVIVPGQPANRPPVTLQHARGSDIPAPLQTVGERSAAAFLSPVRAAGHALFTAEPLVRRSLRRIAVTPLHHRPAATVATRSGREPAPRARSGVDLVQPSAPAVYKRAAEQFWSAREVGATALPAQPFAPVFSSPTMAAPLIIPPSAPALAPAAPPAPDVNRLVDEVMRRIERQTRQDRMRRGL